MTRTLQNRGTAAIITLCVIAFSVLLGANLSLNRLRSRAEESFYYGGNGSWHGISSDLYEVAGNCSNMVTVAGRYMNSNDRRIGAVERCVDALYMVDAPKAKHAAAEDLRAAVQELDAHLATLELAEDDMFYREKLAADIDSAFRTISQSGYNEAARSFNNQMRRFPASILADLTGVEPLEFYE